MFRKGVSAFLFAVQFILTFLWALFFEKKFQLRYIPAKHNKKGNNGVSNDMDVLVCIFGIVAEKNERGRERETERQRETERDRETDRERERQTDRQTDRQTETQTDRQTEKERDRQRQRQTEREGGSREREREI